MKTLVVKLGSAGDVVRTTVILPNLQGEIFWLVGHANQELLLNNRYITETMFFECHHCRQKLMKMRFDLVLSLEEDNGVTRFVSRLKKKKIVGIYFDSKKKRNVYTPTSKSWFDMSYDSRFGLSGARVLKKKNTKTHQHHLLTMLGVRFKGQPYQIAFVPNRSPAFDVGIEKRAGARWPTKRWGGFDQFKKILVKEGIKVFEFKERANFREYIADINNCKVIVCGDSLIMHLGIALRKKVVALFSPTPPQEIYDYGLVTKLYDPAAPCFCSYHATCNHTPRCIDRVDIQTVYQKTKEHLQAA